MSGGCLFISTYTVSLALYSCVCHHVRLSWLSIHLVCMCCCAVPYTPSTVPATSYTATRPDGRSWTLYSAHADYDAAASICEAKGQKLVSAHSQEDAQSIASLAANLPLKWVPGFGLPVTTTYVLVGMRYDSSKQAYTWQDGTAPDWSPAGLSAPPTERNCMVVASNGSWIPMHCSRQAVGFACQSGTYTPPPCAAGMVRDGTGTCGET